MARQPAKTAAPERQPVGSARDRVVDEAASLRPLFVRPWVLRPLLFWGSIGITVLVLAVNTKDLGAFGAAGAAPGYLAAATLAVALAAAERPFGSTLGLAGLLLPGLTVALGAGHAAIAVALGALGAEALRRVLGGRHPDLGGERRGLARALAAAATATWAIWAAGWLLARGAPPGWNLSSIEIGVASSLVFASVLWLGDHASRALRFISSASSASRVVDRGVDRGAAPELRRSLTSAGADAGAWLGGLLLLPALAGSGVTGLPVLFGVGIAAVLLFRSSVKRRDLERQLRDLKRVGSLAERVGPAGRRRADLAAALVAELRHALAPSFVQVDVFDDAGDPQSWWAATAGPPQPGPADPGDGPPPRPGIHRRRRWLRLDRDLIAGERRLGRVRLWLDPGHLDRPDLAVWDQLLPQLVSLVENAALDREARLDSLTGISRRQVFESALIRTFADCRDRGASLAVLLCDIDHFKRVNDTWGHSAGDQALRAVAGVLREDHRDSDLCCRYGGEEFAVLLPDTDGSEALRTAERVRRRVAETVISINGQSLHITLSAGVAAFPELYAESADELIVLADRALYAAKNAGRNRCLQAVDAGAYRTPSGVVLGEHRDPPQTPQL